MHKPFMTAALEQARLGRGICSPNPSVGCVAVHNNQIIARGWHQGAGTAHAEQAVLNQLSPDVDDVTLYVTLEPCNHWGKTPPCVSAILNAGIRSVVFAFKDPNPVVAANNTPVLLAERGVDVLHFPLPEIDDFYRSYTHWIQHKKPWVTAKLAQSFDGKTAGEGGTRLNISNESCKLFTHEQRLVSDIILTTASTILKDEPLLNVRLDDRVQSKPLAILDRQLRLMGGEKVFQTAACCHIFYDAAIPVKNPLKNCQYHAINTEQKKLDLSEVMITLGQAGYHDVWVEAGAELFSSLHEASLVHRSYIYLAPTVAGKGAPAAFMTDIFKRKHQISWQIREDNVIACMDWERV